VKSHALVHELAQSLQFPCVRFQQARVQALSSLKIYKQLDCLLESLVLGGGRLALAWGPELLPYFSLRCLRFVPRAGFGGFAILLAICAQAQMLVAAATLGKLVPRVRAVFRVSNKGS